ncbi:NADPH-dependent 7-cyano-7-deazaguanine reductase QueF [Mangrovitalea sediminis]|uniref:NADPH-dependent 7-cyano-7-deazaguanine reductase QueF n=1 Tax=Mangrovitalea sediminis TaxID=1982043 RepID=UPI000BE57A04|nr:NADPH-dependent 7-cyano-7-deazaguanine reductase QueF [Mangrovitalea sediminis]
MALDKALLGKTTEYPERYAPDVLFPVARLENRQRLGLTDGRWSGFGEDLWRAYEVSWLSPAGLPRVAVLELRVPADSPNLIESKSLKLYLNSFNQEVIESEAAFLEVLGRDLSAAAGGEVGLELLPVDRAVTLPGSPAGYQVLDNQSIDIQAYRPDPEHLKVTRDDVVEERLCSHLLRSLCPVTRQPDWGTVLIDYRGRPLDRAELLRYIVGYRREQDFHEHCVERIFTDIMAQCQPEQLTVMACYTRRGGLDINPWRSTVSGVAPSLRLVRQ